MKKISRKVLEALFAAALLGVAHNVDAARHCPVDSALERVIALLPPDSRFKEAMEKTEFMDEDELPATAESEYYSNPLKYRSCMLRQLLYTKNIRVDNAPVELRILWHTDSEENYARLADYVISVLSEDSAE